MWVSQRMGWRADTGGLTCCINTRYRHAASPLAWISLHTALQYVGTTHLARCHCWCWTGSRELQPCRGGAERGECSPGRHTACTPSTGMCDDHEDVHKDSRTQLDVSSFAVSRWLKAFACNYFANLDLLRYCLVFGFLNLETAWLQV